MVQNNSFLDLLFILLASVGATTLFILSLMVLDKALGTVQKVDSLEKKIQRNTRHINVLESRMNSE